MATRSPDQSREVEFSDSWVLLAVAYAGGKHGADLGMVIGTADYINHAILTYEEASSSLARLVGLGLVRVVRGKLVASASVLGALPKGRSAVHKDLERVQALLQSKPAGSKDKARFSLSRAPFDAAVKGYLDAARVRVNAESTKRAKRTRPPRRQGTSSLRRIRKLDARDPAVVRECVGVRK